MTRPDAPRREPTCGTDRFTVMNTTSLSNARLAAVRDSLAELHRALLDAERRDIERETGRLSPGEYLQMLLHEPRFAWLRPVGRMVATLDGAMHDAVKDRRHRSPATTWSGSAIR